jgi:hypothetical protein
VTAGEPPPAQPLRFKQSPVRMHPGEKRGVTLLADPVSVPPGTKLEIEADPGLTVTLRQTEIPEPGRPGTSPVRLMQAFLEPEVFAGAVTLTAKASPSRQLRSSRATSWPRHRANDATLSRYAGGSETSPTSQSKPQDRSRRQRCSCAMLA